MRIAIIGGGSWGTALGHVWAEGGHEAVVLVRNAARAQEISEERRNERYLPGLSLSSRLRAGYDAATVLDGAEVVVLAVPCRHMRGVLVELAPALPDRPVLICAGKGIEGESLARMSEVMVETIPSARVGVISGPSFAREVVLGKPTAVVLASADKDLAEWLRHGLATETFRVYSSADVVGVELGGALKNVVALAAGVCDGMELGDNARAALITRGLAEISRLGQALGARPATFMGLSGMGDLVLTCTGDLSRNRQVGLRLGRGEKLEAILGSMHMVAEGVYTTRAVCGLAVKLSLDMPIALALNRVLAGETDPGRMVLELMTRALREEEEIGAGRPLP